MVPARQLLEEELKALMEVSADFARGLSTIASRMTALKAQLDNPNNHGNSATFADTVQAPCSSVSVQDRATSPIVFRTDHSTSISPFRFEPMIKVEKEENIYSDTLAENETYEDHGEMQQALNDTCRITQSQLGDDMCTSHATSTSANSAIVQAIGRSQKFLYILKPVKKSEKRKIVHKLDNLPGVDHIIVDPELDTTKLPKRRVDEDIEYATRLHKSIDIDETSHSSMTSEGFEPEIIETSDEYEPEPTPGIFVARFGQKYFKRSRRTQEEKREYNRIRQANYRARRKQVKDLWLKEDPVKTMQNGTVPAKNSSFVLKKEQGRRTYEKKRKS